MQCDWLIIDGYNLLHQVDEFAALLNRDLQGARHRLVRMVEEPGHAMAAQTTLVFDGREAGRDATLEAKHLEVFYSPGHLSADAVIERLVCRASCPEHILVVTSDRAERDTVSSAGAQTMSAEEFLAFCKAYADKPLSKRTPPGREPRLGDVFPDGF